jgi:hypothetical protein
MGSHIRWIKRDLVDLDLELRGFLGQQRLGTKPNFTFHTGIPQTLPLSTNEGTIEIASETNCILSRAPDLEDSMLALQGLAHDDDERRTLDMLGLP